MKPTTPRPGEIPMKEFVTMQAVAMNLHPTTIWHRARYPVAHFPDWQFRRVNARVVFASLKAPKERSAA